MPSLNPIENRIARIQRGDDPCLIAEMPSGFAILANQQPPDVRGCCMLLPHPTPVSLNELDRDGRARFLADLATLGDAILAATDAERINYLILCNKVPALHAHCVPRYAAEDPAKRLMDPFAAYDFASAPKPDAQGDDAELFNAIKAELDRRL